MKRKTVVLATLVGLAILALSVAATASMIIPANDKAREHAVAPDKSPVINETASGEWDLERVDFIHYYAKPSNPGKPPKTATCYDLMGIKWKSLPVGYVINPNNDDGLSEAFVTGAISTSAETWDAATGAELVNDVYGVDYSAEYGVQNFRNAITFGNYPDSNVIAVTSIWYTRRGNQIVEFDILFNTYFPWGDAESANYPVMDLQNIATHELGHGVGLGDIYSTTCAEVTMYGYSGYDETKKRSLEDADKTGLQSIYGT